MSKVPALVLAGGINQVPLYPGYVPTYKAALPLAGRRSIEYVLEALLAAPEVREITVAGPHSVFGSLPDVLGAGSRVCVCEAGNDLVTSLRCGLQGMSPEEPVLVTTGDVPLLTPGAVTDFVVACRSSAWWDDPLAIFLTVVPRRAYTGPYAHFTKPFNHFLDVVVCHGNLAVVHPRLLQNRNAVEHLQNLYDRRKRPLASALSGGLRIALEFLIGVDALHVLTLQHVADTVSQELGIRLLPTLINHPEVTIDIDDGDDYHFVLQQLERSTHPAATPVPGQAGEVFMRLPDQANPVGNVATALYSQSSPYCASPHTMDTEKVRCNG